MSPKLSTSTTRMVRGVAAEPCSIPPSPSPHEICNVRPGLRSRACRRGHSNEPASEQPELVGFDPAQRVVVQHHAPDAAVLRQHPCLRLDLLRREHALHRRQQRVAPPAPELARDSAPEREHDAEVAPPTDEIVREGVQTELVPVPEGEGCPPPWEADADADTVGILVRADFVMTQGMVVGGIGAGRPSLRDRALARAQRREDRRIDREERRAARKARRAAR